MVKLHKNQGGNMPKWTPRVTVAAIVNNREKFLLVKEKPEDKVVYNQPAGHLEDNETLVDAIRREVLEETGLNFNPASLVGIYRWRKPSSQETYLRFAFAGAITSNRLKPGDKDIIEALWLSLSEIEQLEGQLRSPQVMAGIRDYLDGIRYNLDLLREIT